MRTDFGLLYTHGRSIHSSPLQQINGGFCIIQRLRMNVHNPFLIKSDLRSKSTEPLHSSLLPPTSYLLPFLFLPLRLLINVRSDKFSIFNYHFPLLIPRNLNKLFRYVKFMQISLYNTDILIYNDYKRYFTKMP